MLKPPTPNLIYAPAKRGNVALLLMLIGPPGSGKTKSALRLATGLAGPGGIIGGCDTEHGRMLYYAPLPGEEAHPPETFDFRHYPMKEPFAPYKFEEAAVASQVAGHAVWICDSFTAEHRGPGGVLDMHEAELQRMVPDNNYARRDQLKMAAWIEPKAQHNHMLHRFWQCNYHIILCVQAAKKVEMQKNDKGKIVPVDIGYQPLCHEDIPFAMSASWSFDPANPGVPIWVKYFDKLAPLIDLKNPMDEATGARLAAWARGEMTAAPAAKAAAPQKPPPAKAAPDPAPEKPAEKPQENAPPPADPAPETEAAKPAAAAKPDPPAQDPAAEIARSLAGRFAATKVRADHFAITDDKKSRDQIAWLKKHRKADLYPTLEAAVKLSYARTDPQGAIV